jgi:hypothetical protein
VHSPDEIPPFVEREAGPQAGLALILAWLETEPDDEMLGRSALTQMEPLVDWFWDDVADDLVELMATRADLRRVVRGADFDHSVPEQVLERLWRAAHEDPTGPLPWS